LMLSCVSDMSVSSVVETDLVRSVVDDKIHHELHVPLLQFTNELIDVFQFAKQRVNVFVVGLNIVRVGIRIG